MKQNFFFIILCPLLICSLTASGFDNKHKRKQSHSFDGKPHIAQKGTILSPLEVDYDIHYVKLDISMGNTSTYVEGNCITNATVAAATLSEYAFELDSLITIDSIFVNGTAVTVTRSGALCIASVSPALNAGDALNAIVYYHGQTPNGIGFFTHGLNQAELGSGTNILYSVSDMYLGKDWWPCKQVLNDKIDSADIWITVPDSLVDASNGVLIATTPLSGNRLRYEWKTNYPIDYYLICVNIAPFSVYHQTVYFTGSTDTMPILHYVHDSATDMPGIVAQLDSISLVVDYFSQLYGRYPFWQEKYGQVLAPLGGGMEHQTLSTIGVVQTPLMAHELGHQWWGDCITYNSWADIWLSEGFANYSEHLFLEHFWTSAAAKTWRTSKFNNVMTQPGGSVYITDDTMDVSRVFDNRLTYSKGGSVLHMLRYVMNNDSLFLQTYKTYFQLHQFGMVNTDDYKAVAESVSGLELDTFFTQWIYGEGYPKYTGKWNQVGSSVMVRLTQTTSEPTITPLFYTPIDIRLLSATGDTTIRVNTNMPVQDYYFTWSSVMTGFQLDPNEQIINRASLLLHDTTLGIQAQWANNIIIAPNPSSASWIIDHLPLHSQLSLEDMQGRVLWERREADERTSIPCDTLATGNYLLRISLEGKTPVVRKLQRR